MVATDLAQAEARCIEAGERWTRPRMRTYELLAEAGRPLKAYDLIARFGPGRAPAKPTTVYRSLAFLEEHGLAHRIASLNAFVACARRPQRHPAEFLICDCCGRVEEADFGAARITRAFAVQRGFRTDRVLLEARGLCPACLPA